MNRRVAVALVAWLAVTSGVACSPEDGGRPPGDGGDGGGDHGDVVGCTSTAPYCSDDGRSVVRCNPATGEVELVESCYPAGACRSAACVASACPPGLWECVDSATQRHCSADGSAWETAACAEGTICNVDSGQCEAPCRVRVFVLQDSSGSMGDGTPTKWEQAREALRTLLSSPAAADMEFGFGAFPSDGNCAIDGLVAYPVPEANATIIDAHFSSSSPNGNTPLAAALEYMANVDTAANLLDPAYHNALLVVSDGMDTCYDDCETRCMGSPTPFRCLMDCATESETIVAESLTASTLTLRDTRQIRTFVIGFGADVSDLELSAMATNGGTALDHWIPASNVDELRAALQTIIDEMFECHPILL